MTQTSIFPRVSNFDENYIYILYICILPWHSAVTICVGKLPFRHVYFQVRSFVEGKNDYTGWLYSKQIWNLLTAVATGFPYDGRLLWYL